MIDLADVSIHDTVSALPVHLAKVTFDKPVLQRRECLVPALRNLRPVDVSFATDGDNHHTLRQTIEAPAADLFRCLEDGPAWKEWLNIDVEWTSPEPFGVGTTRTVTTGNQTIEEYFLAWEPGRQMAFRFERTTLPVTAFAEDYLIEPKTANSCELAWSYAYEWDGPLAALSGPIFAKAFAVNGKRSLRRLAGLMIDSGARFAEP